MIWHLLEVWALLGVMFALGCVLGALTYRAIARGPFAGAQGVLADAAGDVLERIKVRAGLAPAWRRGRMRRPERAVPEPEVRVEPRLAGGGTGDVSGLPVTSPLPLEVPAVELPPGEIDGARPAAASGAGGLDEAVSPVTRASSAMHVAGDGLVPKRPPGLSGPRGGAPDNLQRIKGIGRRNEAMLNSLGIYHFGQIAAWTPAEIRWIGQYLAYPERIERDDWPGQATLIAMGQDTGFEKSADRRRRRRREEREFASRLESAVETDALAAAIRPPRPDGVPAPHVPDDPYSADPYSTAADDLLADTMPGYTAENAMGPESAPLHEDVVPQKALSQNVGEQEQALVEASAELDMAGSEHKPPPLSSPATGDALSGPDEPSVENAPSTAKTASMAQVASTAGTAPAGKASSGSKTAGAATAKPKAKSAPARGRGDGKPARKRRVRKKDRPN